MKKKCTFILMGQEYDINKDKAVFETNNQITYIYTVNNIEETFDLAVKLKEDGVGAIELCGAFGKDNAEKIIRLCDNKVAIGYVTHNKEQDFLFNKFFDEF